MAGLQQARRENGEAREAWRGKEIRQDLEAQVRLWIINEVGCH